MAAASIKCFCHHKYGETYGEICSSDITNLLYKSYVFIGQAHTAVFVSTNDATKNVTP